MYVLIVEDDKIVNQNICLLLRKEGMQSEMACTGKDGIELIKLYEYDLIILDLMLPDIQGLDVLKQIRALNIQTPVLVLSGLNQPNIKVDCLMAGADDYVVKPYERSELIARVKALIRRSKGLAKQKISIGNLTLDLDKKEAFINNQLIDLTSKEYALLELLALKKGSTVSKESILTHLYGGMDEPEMKIMDVFLCKIRRKMKKMTGGEDYIKTVWGRGYSLEIPKRN